MSQQQSSFNWESRAEADRGARGRAIVATAQHHALRQRKNGPGVTLAVRQSYWLKLTISTRRLTPLSGFLRSTSSRLPNPIAFSRSGLTR